MDKSSFYGAKNLANDIYRKFEIVVYKLDFKNFRQCSDSRGQSRDSCTTRLFLPAHAQTKVPSVNRE